ncbi:MAG: alanine--tRNA ligase [Gammaproteobacteria bacterium]|nr:alanine--tRNA ligase [Gammaproteobacteria bacterium]
MKTAEVRQAYLSYFEGKGHRVVASSTLVPRDDPTLLFTNAGMNQFKDALLGRVDPGYRRAVSSQRCVRAGGKHNDLENVGYTARHLTFFEMLGNFSFGDYFKEETIAWAWAFVTGELKLPKERLWVTVHPTDDESRRLWRDKIGIQAQRVVDHGDNFWAMGDTGPCGPCTEIFYDHGPEVPGGPPGSADEDGDRYIEVWNLVFPQFDRAADGELTPLPAPGVDTGMGLERMATVLQGVRSNFEIDLFAGLMRRAGEFAGIHGRSAVLANPSLRVIADHLRSSAFLIADGVTPGNEDRAYVLRRIIRRGLRHGYKLKIGEPFFHQLADDLAVEMGDAYPLLVDKLADVKRALLAEEERFAETLNQGMELLEKALASQDLDCISGEVLFKLYDTYGFPTDLTADIARERGLAVDLAGFEAEMERQRERGRASARFDFALGQKVRIDSKVDFLGYEGCVGQGQVVALFDSAGDAVESIGEGAEGIAVLDRTPFYAESGGQVGDTGALGGGGLRFEVADTIVAGDQHLHIGRMAQGELRVGVPVAAEVDAQRRRMIRANHSATHLLHAALRRVLGDHVQQRGSLVDADRLRFDFSHGQPVEDAELQAIERLVNDQIQANSEVATRHMSYPEAIESGAVALFGEKYGDQVRVLAMGGDYSVELCGGTHVSRTGDIGLCKVTSESGIAAGVRRIEAVTGHAALARMADMERRLGQLAQALKTTPSGLQERLLAVLDENQALKRSLRAATDRLASDEGGDLAEAAVEVGGVKVVAAQAPGDAKAMMKTLDLLKSQLDRYVIVLGQANGGKVSLVAALSPNLTDIMQAPDLINAIGAEVGARGGGRPELARAGGGERIDRLAGALAGVADWVGERIAPA